MLQFADKRLWIALGAPGINFLLYKAAFVGLFKVEVKAKNMSVNWVQLSNLKGKKNAGGHVKVGKFISYT